VVLSIKSLEADLEVCQQGTIASVSNLAITSNSLCALSDLLIIVLFIVILTMLFLSPLSLSLQVAVDTEEYDDAATLSEQVDELTEQLDQVSTRHAACLPACLLYVRMFVQYCSTTTACLPCMP
jgi:hypothetical protein